MKRKHIKAQGLTSNSFANGKFILYSSILILQIICIYSTLSENLVFPLIIIAASLSWLVIHNKIISFEVFSLLIVLVANLFLIGRFDTMYTVSGGGIIFKISFFVTSFFLLALALNIFFSRSVHKHHLSIHDKYRILSPKKLLLFITIGLISSLVNRENSQEIFDSIYAILYFIIPLCYVYIIPRLQLERSDVYFIQKAIVFFSLLISVTTISASFFPDYYMQAFGWEHFGKAESEDFVRISMPFGSANGIGALLILILPMCYFSYLSEKKKLKRYFLMSILPLIVIAILVTLNRSTLIALLCLSIGFILHRSNRNRIRKYTSLFLVVMLSVWVISTFDFSRYEMTHIITRIESWKTAIVIIKDNPMWGVAPNSLYRRLDTIWNELSEKTGYYSKIDYLSTTYKGHWTLYNPHNVYLMIMVEYGLFGLIIFLWIITEVIKRIRCRLKRKDFYAIHEFYILKGMFWGIAAFLILNFQGGFLTTNYKIATFFWIYVGVALWFSSLLCQETDNYYLKEKLNNTQ